MRNAGILRDQEWLGHRLGVIHVAARSTAAIAGASRENGVDVPTGRCSRIGRREEHSMTVVWDYAEHLALLSSAPTTLVVLAQHQDLVMNIGRKSAAPSTAVNQEVVKVQLQLRVVVPQASDGVRNSRNLLKESKRLDLSRKACHPPCCSGQLLAKRLQPSPITWVRRRSQGSSSPR
jgi:hypothetical protein